MLPGNPLPADVSGTGITGWLKDNPLPLIIFAIGLVAGASRKGDQSRVLLTVALVIVSLAV